MRKLSLALGLLAFAGLARAESVDFNLGPDSFRGFLSGPLSRLVGNLSGQYDTGFIYKEGQDGSADPKDAELKLAHFGVLATGDVGARGAEAAAGLGARLIYADRKLAGDSASGGALAFGGQFDVRWPGYERVGVTGYGWYAPELTSFSGLKSYHEVALDLEFEVVRAAAVYAGYRLVNLKPEAGGDGEVDSSGHIGIRLNF